ncbi:hypothetical protein [Aeromicrobium sp. Leaf350]|uniref:hypothetical protein n=1 Tax=Aeromicrobium sp. Leaf350 TaxID=2876565 RepID=UPI001E5651C5|nr:hypothetical protein [Aeromicrobium sp. Leaf350]
MSSQVPGPVPPPSEPTPPGYGAPAPTPPAYGAPGQPAYAAPGGGGGYGGGGYQPPAPPKGGGGGGKTGLIIGIVVAALVLVAGGATALILILTGGDDSDDEGGDDTTTETDEGYITAVEDYFAAYDDGDCATILDIYPDQFADVEECEDEYPYTDPDDVEIEISSIEATDVDDEADATEATVEVSFTEVNLEDDSEDDYSVEFTLEKDGNAWIVVEYDSV